MNTKINPNAVSEYIQNNLNVKKYISFKDKREIAERIVRENTKIIDGVKKNDTIGQYLSFIAAMIESHTILEFNEDLVNDYDVLAESGLLQLIISEFQDDYNECDIILKMALASELEDNNLNIIVGKLLNGGTAKIDVIKLLNLISKLNK
jgi:hypothetical protein